MRLRNIILPLFLIYACGSPDKQQPAQQPAPSPQPAVEIPAFNRDSAISYVKDQVDFGPRVPNTKAHAACAAYLERQLRRFTPNFQVQEGTATTWDGVTLRMKNIIASFAPEKSNRVLLFAHWDTRPWADEDTERTDEPIDGADDGGSGVGVLLEIARQLSLHPPSVGVDIIFFDAEDWGKAGGGREAEDSYALGTQYWTRQPHVPGYTASYGILLDMVGARGAKFRQEGYSREAAGYIVDKVWSTANANGFSDYFPYQPGGWVTDDHVYVNRMGIPSIDIIGSDPTAVSGFGKHWHTHRDSIEIIDPATLHAVGQTLLAVLYGNPNP